MRPSAVERTRAERAKFLAKGAITGRQIVVPHFGFASGCLSSFAGCVEPVNAFMNSWIGASAAECGEFGWVFGTECEAEEQE